MSQSPEKTGVEAPAIVSLLKLGYTHLPGHAVQVEHRHLAPVLEDVLRPRLLALERGKPGEVYNFGGQAEMANIDLVRMLLKLLDKRQAGLPDAFVHQVDGQAGVRLAGGH